MSLIGFMESAEAFPRAEVPALLRLLLQLQQR